MLLVIGTGEGEEFGGALCDSGKHSIAGETVEEVDDVGVEASDDVLEVVGEEVLWALERTTGQMLLCTITGTETPRESLTGRVLSSRLT